MTARRAVVCERDAVVATAQTGRSRRRRIRCRSAATAFYGQYFNGLIDEVRVYNVALDGRESRRYDDPVGGGRWRRHAAAVGAGDVDAAAAGSSRDRSRRWGAATDNVGVTGYRIERCQGRGCTQLRPDRARRPARRPSGHGPDRLDTSYAYRVRAVDAAGNLGPYSNIASATTGRVTRRLWWRRMRLMRGRGRRWRMRRGTATTGRSRMRPGRRRGSSAVRCVQRDECAGECAELRRRCSLSSAMTLEAWVNPSSVTAAWRDVIYKGNDNYYLMGTTDAAAAVPAGGGHVRRAERECVRRRRRCRRTRGRIWR